jgi:ferrochelatase
MNGPAATNLVLVNLGTPVEASPASVRAFLHEFLSDPAVVDLPRFLWMPILRGMVLRSRPARVAHQYQSIWTAAGSPLRVATERIASQAQLLAGERLVIRSAYRYGEPSIDTVLGRIDAAGAGPIIVTPLFPQDTNATTGTVFRRAREAAARAGVAHRLVERLIPADAAGYIEALAARARAAFDSAGYEPDHLVVSFHGIPVRYDVREGRRYTRDCDTTFEALLQALGWARRRATLAYQSKFGPEPWLKPATAPLLAELPARGVRRVAVITPGFVTEGLETLEEIAIRGRDTFVGAGGESLLYIGAVEDHPAFIQALVALAAD